MHALLSVLLPLLVASADADAVVDGIFRHQAIRDSTIASVSYRGRLSYTETDLRSSGVAQVECERLITMPRVGEQSYELVDVRVDGQRLEGAAREREAGRLHSRGLVALETRMPFFPETREEYSYRVSGPDTWEGMQVWHVEFIPTRPTRRHIRGFARVLDGSFDVVSMEFVPCRLPFVVTAVRMKLDYALVHGYWLPVRFQMDMDLRLAVVVELMRRHIRVEDHYWGHQLNSASPAMTEGSD